MLQYVFITMSRGLDRYYGLLELGEIGGLWKTLAGRYEMNGKKVYFGAILKEPELYFTDEVMQQLDEVAKREFSYGVEPQGYIEILILKNLINDDEFLRKVIPFLKKDYFQDYFKRLPLRR